MKENVANSGLGQVHSYIYGLDKCKEFFIYTNLNFIENAECVNVDINRLKEKYNV